MKKISLIIATYNAESTLERCLNSIISQKTSLIELLVIDGQSTDRTKSILNKYKMFIDYCISERDNGLYDAWNKGVKRSHGEWIMFLGADDIIVPDFFQFYLGFLKSNDISNTDIISAKANVVDAFGNFLFEYGEPYSREVFIKRMNISHGTTLHNKKLFSQIGLFNTQYRICADYEFLLRKKLKAKFCNRVMIFMEFGGLSNSYKGILDSFRVRKNTKCLSLIDNYYILLKGFVSLFIKQLYRRLRLHSI